MDKLLADYGAWMNMLRGNYRKGAGTLRGLLANPAYAQKVLADDAAIMAIYGDVNYKDGSCWCADVIGKTPYAPDAFNRYLNLAGVSDKGTWAETAADQTVTDKLRANLALRKIVMHSDILNELPDIGLNTDTWEFISQRGKDGTHREFYDLRETKDIELTGIGTMTVEIADFDHEALDTSTTPKRAPFSFLTKDLLYSRYQMNTTSTNVNGYNSSALKATLNGEVWRSLPVELRNKTQYVYKTHGKGNNTENAQVFGYSIWIPTEYEMFGVAQYGPASEAVKPYRPYPIFTDDASRIKRMNNGRGGQGEYWLASTLKSDASGFCYIMSNGKGSNAGAAASNGVCFGFAV